MSKPVVILGDERDAVIAESLRGALGARGASASVVLCDASADMLGQEAREGIANAGVIVVVVREGGRGNRLLRAVEDQAPKDISVSALMADASLDTAVSARTEARVQTLAASIAAMLGTGSSSASTGAWMRWPRVLVLAIPALIAVLGLGFAAPRFWPKEIPHVFEPAPPPVSLTGILAPTGWIVTFTLPEEATRIEYKRPGDLDFIATGNIPFSIVRPPDGRPRANPTASIGAFRGAVPFLVRYTAVDGSERGPYEVVFDTQAESVASAKRVLDMIPQWISFRAFDGKNLCYFTTLVAMKYAFKSIRYGVDTEVPERALRFAPAELPGISSDDELYIELPRFASFVTVELVYIDGTSSGPKRFPVQL